MDASSLQQAVAKHLDEIITLRRDLHRHPELSGQEQRTAAVVAQRLRACGFQVEEGIGGYGLIAQIGEGSPCIGLRCDMDALPVTEETGLEYASDSPGVMHACGHDFHTAWTIGAALVLQELGLPRGTVKFIFQPAEETLGGAAGMIAAGALAGEPRLDAIVGAHVMADRLAGTVALRSGPNLAAADAFTVRIVGAGAHGANPNRGRDPIPVAAEIVMALQTLVSRRLDPLEAAVVSVCQFNAGSAYNIIPMEATLAGTVRTLLTDHRDMIEQAMRELCTDIAHAHRCEAEFTYRRGVPATVTDEAVTALSVAAIQEALGSDIVQRQERPSMGGEDFSYLLQQVPGALLWVGCAPDEQAAATMSLHHPQFAADERCLPLAMAALAAIALKYLEDA
ncbi:MAG: amidohydrolase [Armatimonadia bacterium]